MPMALAGEAAGCPRAREIVADPRRAVYPARHHLPITYRDAVAADLLALCGGEPVPGAVRKGSQSDA